MRICNSSHKFQAAEQTQMLGIELPLNNSKLGKYRKYPHFKVFLKNNQVYKIISKVTIFKIFILIVTKFYYFFR